MSKHKEDFDEAHSFGYTIINDGILMTQGFLNTEQVAKELGVSVVTLNKWRATGGGPPFVKFGSTVKYKLTDLDKWVNDQKSYTSTAAYTEEKKKKL